jgi:hypothetical protein
MGRNARLRKMRREARRKFQMDPGVAPLADRFQKKHPGSVVIPNGAGEKMSEVMEDFAEPLLRHAESPEQVKAALLVAMTAWNYAILEESSVDPDDGLNSALLDDSATRQVFEFLLERKRQLYPNNRRVIVDFELIPNGTEYRFNVLSNFA